jgi:hypothetical protein
MLEHICERDATTDVMRPWRQPRPEALARVPAREDGAITQAVLNALS